MKQIVEEWKTIEEFPCHKISNMGRCRSVKYGHILHIRTQVVKCTSSAYPAKQSYINYFCAFRSKGVIFKRSVGMLVAKHFVPNPNGYRHIRYKDGDTSNSIYTNIEWIKSNIPEDRRGRPPRKHYSREEQIALMERQIHYLEKAVEYLKEEKVAEIVYEMYVPYLVKYACRRFGKHDILEEEFISYATDYLIGKLSRGVPVYCINTLFDRLAAQFFAQKALSGGIKAVKFNDAINYKNDAI